MQLELTKNNELSLENTMPAIKSAVTTVSTAFDNAFDKGIDKIKLDKGLLDQVKDFFKKYDIKGKAKETIVDIAKDTAASFLKTPGKILKGIKETYDELCEQDYKGALKVVIDTAVDCSSKLPKVAKEAVKAGTELILGDTFTKEIDRIRKNQSNALERIDNKCTKFEEAFNLNNMADMKKFVEDIKRDMKKIDVVTEVIDRAREVINRYQLVKAKGSTELSPAERELCAQI